MAIASNSITSAPNSASTNFSKARKAKTGPQPGKIAAAKSAAIKHDPAPHYAIVRPGARVYAFVNSCGRDGTVVGIDPGGDAIVRFEDDEELVALKDILIHADVLGSMLAASDIETNTPQPARMFGRHRTTIQPGAIVRADSSEDGDLEGWGIVTEAHKPGAYVQLDEPDRNGRTSGFVPWNKITVDATGPAVPSERAPETPADEFNALRKELRALACRAKELRTKHAALNTAASIGSELQDFYDHILEAECPLANIADALFSKDLRSKPSA